MRRPTLAVLFLATAAGCTSRYDRYRAQERTEFFRQDSSFVNRAVDLLLFQNTPFRSLPQAGVRPREILVRRGDSTSAYQALGVYMTFQFDRTPDACVPPSRASLVAWSELSSRTGINAVSLLTAGDTAGMQDTFSVTPLECNGPRLTLHHPMLAVGRIIGPQQSWGTPSIGRGAVQIRLARGAARPCPAAALLFLESQNATVECRLSWMQVWINTWLPGRGVTPSDTFAVSASVPALHIWMDCRGKKSSHMWCPPQPSVPQPVVALGPSPTPRPPAQSVTVTGVIKDPEEGVPIPYSRVRLPDNSVTYADSLGRFSIHLPPGRTTIQAECFGSHGGANVAGQEPFTVRPYMAEVALFIRFADCKRPPAEVRDSVFEGTWDVGLERSRFGLCGNRTLNVWAELGPQAMTDRDSLLPKLRGKEGPLGFIWRVRGSLSGPGRYGTLTVMDYLLKVEQVLEIRVRRNNECMR